MTDPIITVKPEKFNEFVASIERAYTGKPGCMCGCNGVYRSEVKSIRRIVKNMIKHNEPMRIDDLGIVYIHDDGECHPGRGHYYALYPKGFFTRDLIPSTAAAE